MIRRLRLAAALVATTTLCASAASAEPAQRRVAIVVGANAPAPGRQPLRYAHTDAQRVADTLVRVGRFDAGDVHTLLDPHPAEILAAVDQATQSASTDALLVFYYSGHSDGLTLFPHGEALSLADVRDRLARTSARIKVGILDTCRGGSWTRAKGLTVGPALDPTDLVNVSTEGTALLSSSSGMENAHEADAVKGSFFTHHLTAGLLGAADKSGDGAVTLQEAFDYAKERTIRDSARLAATAQHPSFDVSLRGRQDIVLAQLASSPSALDVAQTQSLEVIHLGTGLRVVETPPGAQSLRLALAPGRYIVRRVADGRVLSKEIEVPAGHAVSISDTQLEAVGSDRIAMKGEEELPHSAHTTPEKGWFEVRVGAGVSTGPTRAFSAAAFGSGESSTHLERSFAGVLALTYGITDRLAWSVPMPALTYRIGTEGTFEAFPNAGLTSIGYSSISGVLGTVSAGVGTRTWVTPRLSLLTNTSGDWMWGGRRDIYTARATGGASLLLGDLVTLSAGAGISGERAVFDDPALARSTTSSIVFGSVQTLGFRQIPLVQVHVSKQLSLDAYASWAVGLHGEGTTDRYLAGLTWTH